jgi:hypothetical protein
MAKVDQRRKEELEGKTYESVSCPVDLSVESAKAPQVGHSAGLEHN